VPTPRYPKVTAEVGDLATTQFAGHIVTERVLTALRRAKVPDRELDEFARQAHGVRRIWDVATSWVTLTGLDAWERAGRRRPV
jgi:hypothetical protein